MAVQGLDHINILTADLAGTKRFYQALLGLEEGVPPPLPAGIVAHWLVDATGHPIVHLMQIDPAEAPGTAGAIHHVALKCDDVEGVAARCAELGAPCSINRFEGARFTQLLVTDPNGVLLELNFAG